MSVDITEAAVRAVHAPPLGERDHDLDPTAKIKRMAPAAAPLARILAHGSHAPLLADYVNADAAAIAAQRQYRRWHWLSILTRYAMIILGMAFLAFPAELGRWAALALLVQLVLSLGALAIKYHLRRSNPFERWHRLRAKAEATRLGFFDRVMRGQALESGEELPPLPLKLEYIRAYLLEPQLAWFQKRARQLGRRSQGKLSLIVLIAMIVYTAVQIVLGVLAQLGIQALPFETDPQLALGRALVGSAFVVLLASTTLAQIDERQSLRYVQTAANLQQLSEQDLPLAQLAAAEGNEPAVQAFVRLVAEQVGFGAAEWLSLEELNAIYAHSPTGRPEPDVVAARRFLAALHGPQR